MPENDCTTTAESHGRRGRRPRVPGERADKKVIAWITPSERAALNDVAAEAGLTPAALLREAVNDYVAEFSERRVFSGGDNSAAGAD